MPDRSTWEAQPACEPGVADLIQKAGINLREATPEIARLARYYLNYYGYHNTDLAVQALKGEVLKAGIWP